MILTCLPRINYKCYKKAWSGTEDNCFESKGCGFCHIQPLLRNIKAKWYNIPAYSTNEKIRSELAVMKNVNCKLE